VPGLTSDANILIDDARHRAQSYRYVYGSGAPVEEVVRQVCNVKQAQTQYGGTSGHVFWCAASSLVVMTVSVGWTGLRPYGVSFLFGGWDKHRKFQLYHSDPSGNFGGWKATAIGSNYQQAQSSLKSDYKEGLDVMGALQLAVKVLMKTIDSASPTAANMELATLTRVDGRVVHKIMNADKTNDIIKTVLDAEATSGDV